MDAKHSFLVAFVLLLASLVDAQATLTCIKSGDDVALSWSNGTSPYRVVRANAPGFFTNTLLAQNYGGTSLNDPNALQATANYYYLISGDGEAPPDENNPAQSPPIITTLTPNTGKPGDSIVIDGSNFGATISENQVFFDTDLATITAASTTQLTVTVPPGALTCLVTDTVQTLTSNGAKFYRLFGGSSFLDLSSICYEDGNGSVWVADRATDDKFYEIFPNETQTARGAYNENIISDLDASATWIYYANSLYSSSNIGTMRRWNVGTDTLDPFRTIGSVSDPVQAIAITPDPLTTDQIFMSDGYRHVIRKVPKTGAIDQDYGNMGSVAFTNPSGLRCDSAGNLYATTSTSLLKITPAEVVTTLVSGLNAPAGIDITERSGYPIILIAEKGAGKVLLYNTISGIVEIVATGLTNPIGVAFTANITTGELYYDVIEPTRILRLPDPIIEINITTPTRALIHKYRSEDDYPDPVNQTQDGRIKITAEMKGITAATTLYFRITDPDDSSAYEPDTNSDDNRGTAQLSTTSATTTNGKASVDLIFTNAKAGDNYQVDVSTSPSFTTIDAQTCIITAWKRVYIEWDKMYRQGSFVKQESGASQTAGERNRIYLVDTSDFATNDPIHIIAGGYGPTKEAFNRGETGTVTGKTADYITIDHDLSLTYTDSWNEGITASQYPHAFAARTTTGYYTSQLSTQELAKAFNDAYVEVKILNEGTGNSYLPHWHDIPGTPQQRGQFINARSSSFFANYNDTVPQPRTNHVQFVSAAYSQYPVPTPPDGTTLADSLTSNSNAGASYADNWTWTYVQSIDDYSGITDKLLVKRDADSHEMGHQHNVNYPDGSPGYGHDTRAAWGAADQCLMDDRAYASGGRNREDGIMQFCSVDAFSIRDHTDDLNQDQ